MFLADATTAEVMKEGEDYEGMPLRLEARLGGARIPVLIDLPAPRLRVYPREKEVAAKLEALVKLGMTNSRMKDFYDLWSLSWTFAFDGRTLTRYAPARW